MPKLMYFLLLDQLYGGSKGCSLVGARASSLVDHLGLLKAEADRQDVHHHVQLRFALEFGSNQSSTTTTKMTMIETFTRHLPTRQYLEQTVLRKLAEDLC
jgi:hypothetical protein